MGGTNTGNEAAAEATCTDHEGNVYPSVQDMCARYGVSEQAYRNRLNRGWTMKEALTGNVGLQCLDYLGQTFSSVSEMCDHYHISYKTYSGRIKRGWDQKAALTSTPKLGRDVTDHLGQTFSSVREMCDHYHITSAKYHGRLNIGWTLEEALTGNHVTKRHGRKKKKSNIAERKNETKTQPYTESKRNRTDHLGNKFKSVEKMCLHYNVSTRTYNARLQAGWSQAEALTGKRLVNVNECTDHLGNVYETQKAMCAHYKITPSAYMYRRKCGFTLEEALTKGKKISTNKKKHACTDHLGNAFQSRTAMCNHYNLTLHAYRYRLKNGLTQEEALTGIAKTETGKHRLISRRCVDHLGNAFQSRTSMCKYYGVTYAAYKYRIKHGATLEEALTDIRELETGKSWSHPYRCTDHLGNVYKSKAAMCAHYGISYDMYKSRLKKGLTQEEALTGIVKTETGKHLSISRLCTDHLGNVYKTKKAMCAHYGIRLATYQYRLNRGATLEEALTGIERNGTCTLWAHPYRCTDHLGNVYATKTAMCAHYNIPLATYMHRLKHGLTQEEALTGIVKFATGRHRLNPRNCTDHLGNVYASITAMCAHYGVAYSEYNYRIKHGATLEEALTGIGRDGKNKNWLRTYRCTDHVGNVYKSERSMCKHYNIQQNTYKNRINRGLTQEEALTGIGKSETGRHQLNPWSCTDHLGNVYESKAKMCAHYGIKLTAYLYRLDQGWTQAKALTTPSRTREAAVDHHGNAFDSIKEMCKYYKVPYVTYRDRRKRGWTKEETLTGKRKKEKA